jgi:hypothetical protein
MIDRHYTKAAKRERAAAESDARWMADLRRMPEPELQGTLAALYAKLEATPKRHVWVRDRLTAWIGTARYEAHKRANPLDYPGYGPKVGA